MADWEKVRSVLNSRSSPESTPHPGDPTALIFHSFITVIRKLLDARQDLSQIHLRVNAGETEKQLLSVGPSLLHEVSSAVQELNRHFEKILSDEERLRDALRGHKEGSVIWVQPREQQDFVDFVSALWQQSGGSPGSGQNLSELIEWALKTNIDCILDNTGVEQSAHACRSVQNALDTFQSALDKMLKTQEELSGLDDVTVN